MTAAFLTATPTVGSAAQGSAAQGSAAPVAHEHHHGHSVYAVERFASGAGRTRIWTPAAGVTVDELYRSLKAQGVPGLIDPSSAEAMAGPGVVAAPGVADEVDCSIQGAYAFQHRCGTNQLRWNGVYPDVHFMDHTGAGWPVTNKVVDWNQTFAVHPVYHWYTTYNCTVNCVHVHDANYGNTTWVGQTWLSWSGVIITSALIQLNDYTADWQWERNIATCHEMGHALGLDHNLYTSSCLYWQANSDVSQHPAAGDYLMLDQIYP